MHIGSGYSLNTLNAVRKIAGSWNPVKAIDLNSRFKKKELEGDAHVMRLLGLLFSMEG